MAWASLDIIPTNVNLNIFWSAGASGVQDETVVKLVPQNSGGTKFDCTAATASNSFMNVSPQLPLALQGTSNAVAPTIVSADATGITLKWSAANLNTLIGGLGGTNAPLSITATDGTTDLLIAQGRVNVTIIA